MSNRRAARRKADDGSPMSEWWDLRLYVAGQTSRWRVALANLKQICEEHLADRYNIQVIDPLKQPRRSSGDQILAIPTLVRRLPKPIRKSNRRPVGHRAGADRAGSEVCR